jgi:DNA-binding NarL/FixJ family response regulator
VQIREAMQADAWGFVCHEDGPDKMLSVLKSVADGRLSFPWINLAALDNDPFEQLSGRELEVLEVLGRGWSNVEISTQLGISENTVKHHLKLIYEKLGVANRAAAVARFLERQLG